MNCRFCGTEIGNQSRFCSSCGKPQDSTTRPAANILLTVLCYIIGVIFVIGGILPYLLQGDLAEYSDYILSLYSKYSITTVTAISCFRHFSSFLAPLFYFSSSAFSVYIGFLILKKESKLTAPTIICAIVHIVSIIYSGVINLLIYATPKFVLSLYISETPIITAGEDVIRAEPDMLYYYQNNAVCRLIISLILIALAVIFLFIKKRYMNSATNDNNHSSVGSIIMLLSISVLSVVSTVLSASLTGSFYGVYAAAANSSANVAFDLYFSSAVFVMFMIIIGIAVLFTRAKRSILAIPIISIITILGFVAYIFSKTLLADLAIPAEILDMTSNRFSGLIVSSAVLLIAMFYWFSSVSRNRIPLWVQIALPISLPLIYTGVELIVKVFFHLNSGISLGLVSVASATVMVSLRSGSNKKASHQIN